VCKALPVAKSGGPAVRYVVNAPIDAFVIGGLSFAVYLVFRLVPSTQSAALIGTISPLLVWGVSYPHFFSTSNRLYGSPTLRRHYPMTALVTPIIFLVGALASFASPGTVAPAFVKLYQLWSPYHFSGQTLGLTLLYARRGSLPIDRTLRRFLTAAIYSTFVYTTARAERAGVEGRFFGVTYPSLNLPSAIITIAKLGVWISVAALVGHLLVRQRRQLARLPWIVLLPMATQFVWFTTAPMPVYRNLVFFFHSLQYLYVAWSLQLHQRLDATGKTPSQRFVWDESARWMAVNIVGGFALFWALPYVGRLSGQTIGFSTAVIFVAIQTHHFFVDGVIWRLRSAGARSPMLSTLDEVSGRSPSDLAVAPS
jgi:uncharacterized membrane protein